MEGAGIKAAEEVQEAWAREDALGRDPPATLRPLTSAAPLSYLSSAPTGNHHLLLWGLYHGRCQTGPGLSGLTGLGVGNLGQWFDGVPSPLVPTTGSQLGPRDPGILGPCGDLGILV